jgi:enoyl-CoA hydratase/3-hydroxyacyl-CoA dehydrogenase
MTGPRNPLLQSPARPPFKRIGVIGAGTIGPDIGYYLKSALPDLELVLVDVQQTALDRALARFAEYAAKARARGKMSAEQAAAATRGVTGTTDYAAIRGADWVLEAVSEDLSLKKQIFAQVEALIAPEALLTSNTSSLPASRLFADLKHKRRATVTHFFAPAWRNPIVEVVRARDADPRVIDDLSRFFCMTGKVPLVTEDVVCFMLDRVFDNWCNEAALCLPGVTAAQIDTIADEFVHTGPFFVLNMANGNPIIVETNTLQSDEEGEHYRPSPLFRSVARWNTVAAGERAEVAGDDSAIVRERLLGVLFSQTVDILDRGIGAPADLDLGCRLALGFKQGPLELMKRLGDAEVQRVMQRFATERSGMPLPKRALAEYQRFERSVLVDRVDDVVVITLRRPEASNALHDEMNEEILAVIRRHEADPAVTGFVVTGYGTRAFCAGADIGRFPSVLGNAAASTQYARHCARLLAHLDAMRKPVVAALNGMTLGGGFELAMRCHALLAHRDAWLQLPEVTLGIVPGLGAVAVPYRRWPRAASLFHGMLRNAERIDATRAREAGIIAELADDHGALLRQAVARVRALAGTSRKTLDGVVSVAAFAPVAAGAQALSREVIGIIEQAIMQAAAVPTLAAALEIGYQAFGRSACTAAAREGITAFGERRKPDFSRTG